MGENNTEINRKDHSSHKTKSKFNIKRVFVILIIAGLFTYLGLSTDSGVSMVKQSHPYGDQYTLEAYYNNAFGEIEWNEDEIDDVSSTITVLGKCNHNGSNVDFEVTYILNDNTYAFQSFKLDGTSQNLETANAFFNQMTAQVDGK